MAEALKVANLYASEHLIINCQDAEQYADQVTAAGSVFVGPWEQKPMVIMYRFEPRLPTYGWANSVSGLSTKDFVTFIISKKSPRRAPHF